MSLCTRSDRFVDLTESESKNLTCNVCLDVFESPVMTICGHTFCKSCIKRWVESAHKECPECRFRFTRKRPKTKTCLIIVYRYVFLRNFAVNSMLDELKIKCDFEFNGCQQIVKFESLSSHIKDCEFRNCKTCGFTAGKPDQHNCFELMRNHRNELLNKNEENQKKLEEWDQLNKHWSEEYPKLQEKWKQRLLDSQQETQELQKKLTESENKSKEWQKRSEDLENELKDWKYNKLVSIASTQREKTIKNFEEKVKHLNQKLNLLNRFYRSLQIDRMKNFWENVLNTDSKEMFTKSVVDNSFKSVIDSIKSQEKYCRRKTEYIIVGNFRSESNCIEIHSNGFKILGVRSYSRPGPARFRGSLGSISIPFHKIQTIMCCKDKFVSAIAIKLCSVPSIQLKEAFFRTKHPKDKKLDVNSNDPKYWYIIVVLESDSEVFQLLVCTKFNDWCQKQVSRPEFRIIDSNKMLDLIQKAV